jgi:hypothetical protein
VVAGAIRQFSSLKKRNPIRTIRKPNVQWKQAIVRYENDLPSPVKKCPVMNCHAGIGEHKASLLSFKSTTSSIPFKKPSQKSMT